MDFIEDIRVSLEGAQTGIGAEIDGPAAILEAWKIRRVAIVEDPST